MDQLLALSGDLPEVIVEPGDVVVREGEAGRSLWVLVDGDLRVDKAGVAVNRISAPGSVIGEVSALLGTPATATVIATRRSTLRHAADAAVFLSSHPEVTHLVAVGLAERLNFVTSYLADLKEQYGDAPGLSMVPDVLRRLSERQGPPARPGSQRDPQPEY